MEKPQKDLLWLKSWRPLSLLNCDGKIYSKILANRMYSVLPQITHLDQTGFMADRSIGQNLLDLVSAIEIPEYYDISSLLISVDFEKAFDTVDWDRMHKIFEFFNFGPVFRNMVKLLYKDITSCFFKTVETRQAG